MNDAQGRALHPERLRFLTLAQMKALRRQSGAGASNSQEPPLQKQARTAHVPLSYAQERLWFSAQLGLTGPAYNMAVCLELEGALQVPALERSYQELLRRHEALRTHFESLSGSPVQIIDAPEGFALSLLMLSPHATEDAEAALQRLIREASDRPFDLMHGPLVRGTLIKISATRHVLLITMHHIVSDGWSLEVLNKELGAAYRAYSQGSTPALPELPIQYVDYAMWQRQSLQGERLEQPLRYWMQQLAGAPPLLELPTDKPRPTIASYRGRSVGFDLPASLCAGLEDLARRRGATLFMVILAALQLFLSRYSSQDDIVVGSPIAGRTEPKTEGLIGFFVNMLALRTRLSGAPTFLSLIDRVKHTTLEAYAHQEVPFEKLVLAMRPERHLSHQPLFQVTLAMHNFPQEPLELPGLRWTRIEPEFTTALFDLALHIHDTPNGRRAVFEYALDLFEGATIKAMVANFRALLEEIVAHPDRSIHRLQLLTPGELEQVLRGFNQTAVPYCGDQLTHELFEAQVRRTPDAIALVCQGASLTYAQLNQRADQLERYLRGSGVQRGEFVPLLMPRSIALVVAELAVLKAGAAYVPLDPQVPPERQAFLIQDCAAKRVLIVSGTRPIPDLGHLEWIDCTECAAMGAALPSDEFPREAGSADDPAYLMYTSGSTGIPKGVIVPHRAINRLVVHNDYAPLEGDDCVAFCSNPAFDASTFEIWGPLLQGARILIVPQCIVLEPSLFVEALREGRVTAMFLTVGLFTQYIDALKPIFSQFRYVLTGGDVVEPQLLARVLDHHPSLQLRNAYGPTECTTFSTTYWVKTVEEGAHRIPIGRPISNTQVYILDRERQPVPIGVIGEIHIGGPGVALGYLNRPELTQERFFPDPYRTASGATLYKTGDLGYWRADGNVVFVGRNDHQVKIRGFRIELGEIEAQLLKHPQIQEATVVVRASAGGEKQLVAYCVPRNAQELGALNTEALMIYLKTGLPDYMIPHAFVVLDRLPLTVNGKIDRKALPEPDAGAYGRQAYVPPQGPVEVQLAAIWQTLLGLERVGRTDHFFERGGHSLLAIQLMAQIDLALQVHLPVVTVFKCPTIQLMAEAITAAQRASDSSHATRIEFDEGQL
jgi:amino acid adenylation domain-containing protein